MSPQGRKNTLRRRYKCTPIWWTHRRSDIQQWPTRYLCFHIYGLKCHHPPKRQPSWTAEAKDAKCFAWLTRSERQKNSLPSIKCTSKCFKNEQIQTWRQEPNFSKVLWKDTMKVTLDGSNEWANVWIADRHHIQCISFKLFKIHIILIACKVDYNDIWDIEHLWSSGIVWQMFGLGSVFTSEG